MELGQKPRQNPNHAVREIDGMLFIMNPDTSELHQLNEVGARVWQLLDGHRTVAEMAQCIEAEFEVDLETAESDALAFLGEMAAKDLIQV